MKTPKKELLICVCWWCLTNHHLGCSQEATASDIQAVTATSK
jgi:hypothetical protein